MPLEEAFAVYEEYRAVMMEFINTVPDYLTTISPKVRHLILKAAWFMDKKYYTAQMRELLDALKARLRRILLARNFWSLVSCWTRNRFWSFWRSWGWR